MLPSLLAKIERAVAVTPESLAVERNAVELDAAGRDNLESTAQRKEIGSPAGPPPLTNEQIGQWVLTAAIVGGILWLCCQD